MAKNKLSIYLVKENNKSADRIFKSKPKVLHQYSDTKIAYYVDSKVNSPSWLKTFFNSRENDDMGHDAILNASAKVVLLVKREFGKKTRIFALSFGYGKILFADDVLEERFGLKVLLNSINDHDLRKISTINIGGNYRQSQSQIPTTGSIAEFGFDVERDLVRSISAKTNDPRFDKSIAAGGDIFAVTVDNNVDNIENFLDYCYEQYQSKKYIQYFEWIDNIAEVRSKTTIAKLNEELVELIKEEAFDKVWSAVPEIISWEDADHFRFNRNRHDDISIQDIYFWLDDGNAFNVDFLKQKHIQLISSQANGQVICSIKAPYLERCCVIALFAIQQTKSSSN